MAAAKDLGGGVFLLAVSTTISGPIISAGGSKKIALVGGFLVAAGDVNLTISCTNFSFTFNMTTGWPIYLHELRDGTPFIITDPGEALTFTLDAAVRISGWINHKIFI